MSSSDASRHCIYTYVRDTGSGDSIGEEVLCGIVRVFAFLIAIHPHTEAWVSGKLSVYGTSRFLGVGVHRCNVPSIISFSHEINFSYVSTSTVELWVKI